MNIKQIITLGLIAISIPHASLLLSQEKSQINELTLNASYFTHNITFPFTSLSFQNQGIEINLEMIRNRNRKVSLLYNSSLSWYYHEQFANAFLFDFAIGCNIKPKSGLFFNADIGLGYQLSLTPVYMYELNDDVMCYTHGGSMLGSIASAYYFPDSGITLTLSANIGGDIHSDLADLYADGLKEDILKILLQS